MAMILHVGDGHLELVADANTRNNSNEQEIQKYALKKSIHYPKVAKCLLLLLTTFMSICLDL
jgi:hypothetical protein